MATVGEKLRQARAGKALTLEQVAASTRIALKYLEAMEADNRAAFPAAFFYKSFIMQYAGVLELNDPEIAASLDTTLAAEAPLPLPGQEPTATLRTIAPLQAPRSARFAVPVKFLTSLASFVVVLAGCAGIYAWWDSNRWDSQRHRTPVPAGQTVQTTPSVVQAPAPLQAQAQMQADPHEAAESPANARLSLTLAAIEATWLSLSSDGKPVFSGVLEPHQSKSIAAEERAKVVVGNAGGLSVQWNGRPIGLLGKRGQVRVVTFTPDGYQFADSSERIKPAEHPLDSTR